MKLVAQFIKLACDRCLEIHKARIIPATFVYRKLIGMTERRVCDSSIITKWAGHRPRGAMRPALPLPTLALDYSRWSMLLEQRPMVLEEG